MTLGHETACSCPRGGSKDLDSVTAPDPRPKPKTDRYTGWTRTIRLFRCYNCGYAHEGYGQAVAQFDRATG